MSNRLEVFENGELISVEDNRTSIEIAEGVFNTGINAGYTSGDITIDISQDALTEFSKQLQLLQLVGAPDNYSVSFADRDGVLQSLTFGEFKTLLIGAGQQYLSLWTTFKSVQ